MRLQFMRSTLSFFKQPIIVFLITFFALFYIMYFLFLGYVAVTDTKGIYNWRISEEWNLIAIIRNGLKYPVMWFMEICGHEAFLSQRGVYLKEGGGINISFSCLGIKIMLFYISLILAYPGRRKLLFLVSGLFMIQMLNISRMVALLFMLLYHQRNKAYLAHDIFNYGVYVIILLFIFVYIKQKEKQASTK
jgi:exosortase/archaeosortase family protein